MPTWPDTSKSRNNYSGLLRRIGSSLDAAALSFIELLNKDSRSSRRTFRCTQPCAPFLDRRALFATELLTCSNSFLFVGSFFPHFLSLSLSLFLWLIKRSIKEQRIADQLADVENLLRGGSSIAEQGSINYRRIFFFRVLLRRASRGQLGWIDSFFLFFFFFRETTGNIRDRAFSISSSFESPSVSLRFSIPDVSHLPPPSLSLSSFASSFCFLSFFLFLLFCFFLFPPRFISLPMSWNFVAIDDVMTPRRKLRDVGEGSEGI